MSKTNWQYELQTAVTDPFELLNALEIDPQLHPNILMQVNDFPLLVPCGFVARMQKNDINDPLLRQVLPLRNEQKHTKGFCKDPLAEGKVNPVPGLLHKYYGRVLITITGVCAINCRFCFRRYFSLPKNILHSAKQEKILSYLAKDKTISEVILSGGEPLLEDDAYLKQFAQRLVGIEHVKYLRIHSRMPIVIPTRITDDFLQWFAGSRLRPIMVIHCNHANEIDNRVAAAMQRLQKAGITILNQAVLLNGINDNAATLIKLSQTLFDIGVLPYYLYLLDKVQGAAHFAVSKKKARLLVVAMLENLPGYLVPKVVYEDPERLFKVGVSF